MKLLFCFAICMLTLGAVYAQGAANNWYFGDNAGLNFTTSPPTAIQNGRLNTLEGCATISNEQGNLLFYTDGSTVYNKDHQIMENGQGLYGNASSTQSAIIIPQPENDSVYYIFTIDSPNDVGAYNGLNYSIVDFSTNPLGEVTLKNRHLLNYSSEKLSAVIQGCDSESVWMVTFSSFNPIYTPENFQVLNTFYAYEITPNGVNTVPVKSQLNMFITDLRGNLKFSPDGSKIAAANLSSPLYLMDFNSLTGVVSNPKTINIFEGDKFAYGVEFSPDNRYLYVDSSNDLPPEVPASSNSSTLSQFDLESANIAVSQVVLHQANYYRGSLQLGPDGKIYRALSRHYQEGIPYLGVIENPNEAGTASTYIDQAINLGSGLSYQGLPPFNQSLFNTIDIIKNNESTSQLNLCEGETYTLKYDIITGATYSWYLNDVKISGETSQKLNIKQDPGRSLPYTDKYELYLNLNDGSTCEKIGLADVTYNPYPKAPDSIPTLTQCEDSDTADGYSIFNLDEILPDLTGGNKTLQVTYFETEADAQNQTNSVEPFGYANKQPQDTL
ncbi:MAG: hypothetical protein V7767_13195, partial [Leeuwenhoekiella sp.]